MPVNRKFDIILDGKGYMLSRATQLRGRAWQRTGQPDAPTVEPPRLATEYGGLPSQLDHAEVWTDWSGGFGYAYRRPKDENSYFGFLANPNTYHWAENFDARFPYQLIHCQQMKLLPDSTFSAANKGVLNIVDLPALPQGNQFSFVGADSILLLMAASGGFNELYPTGLATDASAFIINTQVAPGTPANAPGRPALFGSFTYTATTGTQMQNIELQTAGADYTGTQVRAGWATAGNRLWGYHGALGGRKIYVNSVAEGADPIVPANWSATLSLGNGYTNINDMVAFRDQVFVGMENGLYAGDQSGTFINVLNDLSGQAHADNCRDIAIQGGQLIAQHIAGVYAYNPTITTVGQVREIGPDLHSNRSPITGRIRALEVLGPWLYAGLWTGSTSYLLAGRDEDPSQPYTWHTLNRYPHTTRPQRIHVDGITTSSGNLNQLPNRMWAATDPTIVTSGTAPLYWWPIPMLNGNPLVQQTAFSANYVGSARIDLGSVDSRTPATPKVFRSVEVQAENLASGYIYANVYYTVDGTGTRTLLGQVNQSPRSTLFFPSTVGSFTTGYAIELSLESFTATQALTPVYRSIVLRSTLRPRSIDLITAVVDIADATSDRQGGRLRPGAIQLNELRSLAVQQAPVLLVDLAGATSIVEVLAPVEEQEVYQEGDRNPYTAATIKMAVLSYTGT